MQLRTSERIIFERAGVGARPRSGCWAHQLLRSAVLALYIGKRNTLPESRRHVCRPSHVKKHTLINSPADPSMGHFLEPGKSTARWRHRCSRRCCSFFRCR